MKITDKQIAFCDEYLTNGLDASAAYRKAYNAERMKPEVIHVKACELLKSGKIAVVVAEFREQRRMRAKEQFEIDDARLVRDLLPILHADVRKLFTPEGYLKDIKDLDDETAAVIADFVVTERVDGEVLVRTSKIKLHSKLDAIEKLARHIGFYERDNRQKVPVQVTATITDEEFLERLGRLYPRPVTEDERLRRR